MTTEVLRLEWWAEIVLPFVYLARLRQLSDGSCDLFDVDGNTHAFQSYSEATDWLGEDGYALVSELIEDGELPGSFPLPTAIAAAELQGQMRYRGPELQAFLDQKFFESLGSERREVACRRAGCRRGAVESSALCALHHFENVMGRPYVDVSGPDA